VLGARRRPSSPTRARRASDTGTRPSALSSLRSRMPEAIAPEHLVLLATPNRSRAARPQRGRRGSSGEWSPVPYVRSRHGRRITCSPPASWRDRSAGRAGDVSSSRSRAALTREGLARVRQTVEGLRRGRGSRARGAVRAMRPLSPSSRSPLGAVDGGAARRAGSLPRDRPARRRNVPADAVGRPRARRRFASALARVNEYRTAAYPFIHEAIRRLRRVRRRTSCSEGGRGRSPDSRARDSRPRDTVAIPEAADLPAFLDARCSPARRSATMPPALHVLLAARRIHRRLEPIPAARPLVVDDAVCVTPTSRSRRPSSTTAWASSVVLEALRARRRTHRYALRVGATSHRADGGNRPAQVSTLSVALVRSRRSRPRRASP